MSKYQTQVERVFESYDALTSQLATAQPVVLQNGQTLTEVYPDLVQRVRELRETLRVLDPDNDFGW